jgi:anaerobic C4-dicarboxylate transporter
VVASAISHVEVRKLGLDLAIADYAQHSAFLYGLLAVTISVAMGWVAGRFFTRN